MSKELMGIDIGGTNIKVGRIKNDAIEKENYVGVNTSDTAEKTLDDLFHCIDTVFTENIQAIGIGVPAVVNDVTGIVYDVQNIPSWKEIPLKELLQERYNLPVFINNDANCFAFGEKIFGKGRSYKNFIGLSLGTGIGMGVVINNNLYSGVLCGAGEVGMIPYKDSILEHYASSFFFTKKYNQSAKTLSESAAKGDALALKAFDEFGAHLGEAIKIILYMYAPEAIILGGSISKAFPFFEESMKAVLKTFAYQKQIENFKIETSNQSGLAILGAAALCLQDVTNLSILK